jgi:transposase
MRTCALWSGGSGLAPAFEAAQTAARPASPDHDYYLELKQRLGANRAALTIARKLLRRAHHTLRALGDDALAVA